MVDRVVRVTQQGLGNRLGGSLKGALVGVVLAVVAAGACLLGGARGTGV
jgi:hypothetical protein